MQADPVERLTYAEPNPTATALKRAEEQKAREAAGQDDAEWSKKLRKRKDDDDTVCIIDCLLNYLCTFFKKL